MSDTKKKKSVPVGKPLPDGLLGTKEAAKRLGCSPRELRVWLRGKNGSNGGERYSWKPSDMTKLAADYKDHKADAEKTEAPAAK
jgi:hypothetical protein